MAASAGTPEGDEAGGARPPGAAFTAADFAWEFLRRNEDYRAEFARASIAAALGGPGIDPRWGLLFPADPTRPSPSEEVFWRPDVAPGVVLPLMADPRPMASVALRLPAAEAAMRAGDAWHLRLPGGLQLLFGGETGPVGPVVVVLAFDRDYRIRLKAAQALCSPGRRRKSRLSAARTRRLEQAVVALDGSLGGRSYREIALGLFGPEVLLREPWKTASARDVTIRLVRAGQALMRGGYLNLLRGGL